MEISLPGRDHVDTAKIFSEKEIFLIGGFLADRWGGPDAEDEECIKDIEEAITAALQYEERNAS